MATTTSAQQILRNAGVNSAESRHDEYWKLIERYRAELVNQAFSIIGSIPDAEDAVQETFCEAFRHSEQLAQARSLGAWLRSINKINALDKVSMRRRDSKRMERKQAENPQRTDTTGGFSALESREVVATVVETLSPEMRSVIVLRHWEGLSYADIARRLSIPPTSVWRLAYDASVILHDKLAVCLDAGNLRKGIES